MAVPPGSDKLLGDLAVEKGYITQSQLAEALRDLEDSRIQGRKLSIGQVLVKKRFITVEQFVELLKLQNKYILQCNSCGAKYNVFGKPEGKRFRCKHCGQILTIATDLKSVSVMEQLTPQTPYGPPQGDTTLLHKLGILPGAVQFQRYEIIRELGRGGMGVVLLAKDRELNRHVAIKILREAPTDAEVIKRFIREAQVIAKLSHPNIVQVYEIGSQQNIHYFTMQYIDGKPLDVMLHEHKITPEQAVAIVEKVARAVHFAHGNGIVHRDLKPSNVMVDGRGEPYVMDFGLAKTLDAQSRLTRSGSVVGTPFYMAPEQVRGELSEIDARSDVYALGVMLYELVVGRVPFMGATEAEVYEKILTADPPRPREQKTYIPADLETIILKAMEKDRAARYPTAEALANDIRRYLAGEPIEARPPSLLRTVVKKMRRQKAVFVPLVVACVLCVAFGLFLYVREAGRRAEAALKEKERQEKIAACLAEAEACVETDPKKALDALYRLEQIDPNNERGQALRARAEQAKRALQEREELQNEIEVIQVAIHSRNFKEAETRLARLQSQGKQHERIPELLRIARGIGSLTVRTAAPSEVEVRRFHDESLELLQPPVIARQAPFEKAELQVGVYQILVKRAPEPLAVVFRLDRTEDGHPQDAVLDLSFEAPASFAYVPEGPFIFGGAKPSMRRPIQSPRDEKRHLRAYLIARRETTNREYNEFLESRPTFSSRLAFLPSTWKEGFMDPAKANHPVAGLNFARAYYYALWRGDRLPLEEEYEKAARGIDGRLFPWGNDPRHIQAIPTEPQDVSAPTVDVSPYLAYNLCSGVSEWTHNPGRVNPFDPQSIGLPRGAYSAARIDPQNLEGPLLYQADFVGLYPLDQCGVRLARGVLPPTANTLESLRPLLHDPDWTVRFEAARAMAACGAPARDALLNRLSIEDSEAVVVRILHTLRLLKIDTVEALKEALRQRQLTEERWLEVGFAAAFLGFAGGQKFYEEIIENCRTRKQLEHARRLMQLGCPRGLLFLLKGLLQQGLREEEIRELDAEIRAFASRIDCTEVALEMLQDARSDLRYHGMRVGLYSLDTRIFRKLHQLAADERNREGAQHAKSYLDQKLRQLGLDPFETLTERIRTAPGDSTALEDRAFAWASVEEWQKCIEDCEAAARIKPTPRAVRLKAYSLMKLNRLDDAIRAFGEALELARQAGPKERAEEPRCLAQRAVARYLKNDLEAAFQDVQQALSAQVNAGEEFYLLALKGYVLSKLGRKKEAAPAFEAALRKQPSAGLAFTFENIDLFEEERVWSEYRRLR